MKKNKIDLTINNFKSFEQIIIAMNKVVDGLKISVNDSGITIYARNTHARFSTTSNCVTQDMDGRIIWPGLTDAHMHLQH